MTIDLFYPAPEGLPAPVDPPRGDDRIYRLVSGTDWRKGLELRSDRLVRAGALWLHGFLDEAHRLTQQDSSPEGAYWHALVHRSEGDFSNALYWFRRAGDHPVQARLRDKVQEAMKEQSSADWQILLESPRWEPARLVELCERSSRGEPAHPAVLQEVVRMEYNLLMEYVLDQAR